MQNRCVVASAVLALLVTAAWATAHHQNDAKALGMLRPSTLAVVHVDVDQTNARSIDSWLLNALSKGGVKGDNLAEIRKSLQAGRADCENWLAGFRKAGGHDVYTFIDESVIFEAPYMVVPIEHGANAEELAAQIQAGAFIKFGSMGTGKIEDPHERQRLQDHFTMTTKRIGDVIVFATIDEINDIKATAATRPAIDPNLLAAFNAAGPHTAITVALARPRGHSKLFSDGDAAAQSSTTQASTTQADPRKEDATQPATNPATQPSDDPLGVLAATDWAMISFDTEPNPHVDLILQDHDEASAVEVQKLLNEMIDESVSIATPAGAALVSKLRLHRDQTRLTAQFDDADLEEAVSLIYKKLAGDDAPTTQPASTRPGSQ